MSARETKDLNILTLVKGTERYVFAYDDDSRAATLRTLGMFASNPALSFTWYDAAVLSRKIREESAKVKAEAEQLADEPWRESLREDDNA